MKDDGPLWKSPPSLSLRDKERALGRAQGSHKDDTEYVAPALGEAWQGHWESDEEEEGGPRDWRLER